MPSKVCTKCGADKALEDFYLRATGRPVSRCKLCTAETLREWRSANPEKRRQRERDWRAATSSKRKISYEKWRRKRPETVLLNAAKHRAMTRGLPFSIIAADVPVPALCPILGIPLWVSVNEGQGGKPNSPSIDRIRPELGYVPGNVRVISHLANMMKSCATPDQLITFAEWVLATHRRSEVA